MSGTYQRRIGLSGAQSIVSMPAGVGTSAAIAAGMERLAGALGGIAVDMKQDREREEQRTAVAVAEEEGRTVSLRDEEGNLRFAELGDMTTVAGKARGNIIRTRTADDFGTATIQQATEIRRRNASDPAAVAAALKQYRTDRLAQVERDAPWFHGQATSIIDREITRQNIGAAEVADSRNMRLSAISFERGLGEKENALLGFADAGQLDGPEGQASLREYQQQLDRGVAAGHLLPDDVRMRMGNAENAIGAIRFASRAERVAQAEGPTAGRAALEADLRGPEGAALGAQQQAQARAEGLRRINLVDQQRQYQQGELRGTLSTVLDSVNAGVKVAPERLEGYARRAETAGMRGEAANFRALATVQGEVSTYSSLSLPQLVQMGTEATTADPEDRATPLRRQFLARAAQTRMEALRQDPVGFARSQPLVQGMLGRYERGEDGVTMTDVVRAQDAILSANGVDPIGHRIVSDSEVQKLKEAMQSRPVVGDPEKGIQGTADMVAAVFNLYGPENRHRVWNDLRRGGLPEELRPVALLLISPTQQNAFRGYLQAVRDGGDEALAKLRGSDMTRDVRAEVAKQLQPLRLTEGTTGQDQALMSDATRASETLALSYANGTTTAAQAAERAVREVVDGGMRLVTDDPLGRYRVPRGVDFDAPAFQAVLGRMLGRASGPSRGVITDAAGDMVEVGAEARPGDGDALSRTRFRIPPGAVSPDLTPDQQQEQFRRSLTTFGQFRTAPDGRGVWLYEGGASPRAVFTEDGQPYGVRFGEERDPAGPAVLRRAGQISSGRQRSPEEFAAEFGPMAERAGAQLGISPRIILGQLALETGWGRSFAGRNNPFNMTAARGADATEGQDRDRNGPITQRFQNFASADEAADHYAARMRRLWPDAVGAGDDLSRFTRGLKLGQQGGYSTDPDGGYHGSVASLIRRLPGRA